MGEWAADELTFWHDWAAGVLDLSEREADELHGSDLRERITKWLDELERKAAEDLAVLVLASGGLKRFESVANAAIDEATRLKARVVELETALIESRGYVD